MEQKKDSDATKMQRILSNHCLQSLVFEKRQRKQTTNSLATIYANIHQKQMQKKVTKKIETPAPKNKKAIIAAKKESKREKEEQKNDKSKGKNLPRLCQNRGRPKKSQMLKKKISEVKTKKHLSKQKQVKIKQQQVSQQKLKIVVPEVISNKSIVKETKEPIAKNIKESILQLNKNEQVDEADKISDRAEQSEKNEEIVRYSQEEQQEQQDQEDENIEREAEQQEDITIGGRVLRSRKTKGEALKKFTMLDDLQIEDDQQECYYEGRRRKTVGGRNTSKIQTRSNLLNRIFRKTTKANLPSFTLNANCLDLNLSAFSQKFGTFDLVHFSIPVEMLTKIPEISPILPKGFVFIWVQKREIPIGYHILNRWGFDVIDQIMWIKTDKKYDQLIMDEIDDGEIFSNARSTCLVGYKCSLTQKTQYCTKISNNIIFAYQEPHSISKPDEIYEIGDLMMPGAKKLEIGAKQIGGWLSLKHKQQSLLRCHQCLKRHQKCQFYIAYDKNMVICEICANSQKMPKQNNEEGKKEENAKEDLNKLGNLFVTTENLKPILSYKIKDIQNFKCSECSQKIDPLKGALQTQQSQPYYCLKCFLIKEKNNEEIHCVYQQEYLFLSRAISCAQCKKKMLFRQYYECINCKKDHLLCSDCFWALSQNKIQKNGQEQVAQVSKCTQWKHKQILSSPQTKTNCFTCQKECSLPYWACETCQGWYWCGNCNKQKIPQAEINHCHYAQPHYQYLVV